MSNGEEFGKNVTTFGADDSCFEHADNRISWKMSNDDTTILPEAKLFHQFRWKTI